MPYGEMTLHGLKLDWKRFTSDQMLDFCKAEAAAVRTYSDAPVTINMMGPFDPLNYFRWAKELDIVSEDSYPFWHTQEDTLDPAVMAAFRYSLIRSLKKQPFLLMESVTSAVNWHPRCTLKRPGMHELSSLQAVSHGSNSVQYFQWRKSRGGSEKFHGAVVDHRNGENTRVFREVAHLGQRLEALSDKVMQTCNRRPGQPSSLTGRTGGRRRMPRLSLTPWISWKSGCPGSAPSGSRVWMWILWTWTAAWKSIPWWSLL